MNAVGHRGHRDGTEVTELNALTDSVIGAAIEVHRQLGPGLLESAYQRALAHEFRLRGIPFEEQRTCPISYKELIIDGACRLDFLVDGRLVVEMKAVDVLEEVHTAQVLTYLKFAECPIGLLLNFRSKLLTHGLRRIAL